MQIRKKGGKLPAGLLHREGIIEALALHALLHRVARLAEGIVPAQIDAEIAAWPLPRTSLLGSLQEDSAVGERPTPEQGDSAERPKGRRRRRKSGSEAKENPEPAGPAWRSGKGLSDDDEATPDEDAAIAAFTAALGTRTADDD
jgi:hypothetical protein